MSGRSRVLLFERSGKREALPDTGDEQQDTECSGRRLTEEDEQPADAVRCPNDTADDILLRDRPWVNAPVGVTLGGDCPVRIYAD